MTSQWTLQSSTTYFYPNIEGPYTFFDDRTVKREQHFYIPAALLMKVTEVERKSGVISIKITVDDTAQFFHDVERVPRVFIGDEASNESPPRVAGLVYRLKRLPSVLLWLDTFGVRMFRWSYPVSHVRIYRGQPDMVLKASRILLVCQPHLVQHFLHARSVQPFTIIHKALKEPMDELGIDFHPSVEQQQRMIKRIPDNVRVTNDLHTWPISVFTPNWQPEYAHPMRSWWPLADSEAKELQTIELRAREKLFSVLSTPSAVPGEYGFRPIRIVDTRYRDRHRILQEKNSLSAMWLLDSPNAMILYDAMQPSLAKRFVFIRSGVAGLSNLENVWEAKTKTYHYLLQQIGWTKEKKLLNVWYDHERLIRAGELVMHMMCKIPAPKDAKRKYVEEFVYEHTSWLVRGTEERNTSGTKWTRQSKIVLFPDGDVMESKDGEGGGGGEGGAEGEGEGGGEGGD